MTVFMLDTNICSYIIRKRPDVVRLRMNQAIAEGSQIVISTVTYYEMRSGAASIKAFSKLGEEIEAFCARLHGIIPFDREAASEAATLYGTLASQGQLIGNNDLLIAGHALAVECVIVTNNTREFQRVPGLDLENWIE